MTNNENLTTTCKHEDRFPTNDDGKVACTCSRPMPADDGECQRCWGWVA